MTPLIRSQFKHQGYAIFHKLFDTRQIDALRNAATTIVDDFDANSHSSIFSTKEDSTSRDKYFLDSGDKIRCFFEEEAFDEHGNLVVEKALSINKIGHALHSLHPVFNAFSTQQKISEIANEFGCIAPQIHQSMYIFKQPNIGGEVRWHQDATYFYTTPQSVLTFWFALEDATLQNGCLQVMDNGGNFPMKEQFKRFPDNSTKLVSLQNLPWPTNDKALPLEVEKGSLVVFRGNLPHFSAPNRSEYSRHAYTLHITSGDSSYHANNWLQAKSLSI